VDAAYDGDTIELGPGTFGGGIEIDKSVQLLGVSAAATIIRGGGPVITIGELLGPTQPTVSISRVTITGGLNTSKPDSFLTGGGGVWIPQGAGDTTGATVTISDSVIARNRVTPVTPLPLCGHVCAFASGGGIDNHGTLTVANTRISDNVAGSIPTDPSVASNAAGGGIVNGPEGTLTLHRCFVTGNRATVSPPNGRFTDGGGIVDEGVLTIQDSVVSGNHSDVAASVPSVFPFDVEQEANAGGILLGVGSSATITRSRISGNSVHSSNVAGDVQASAGGINARDWLVLTDSSVDHNTVSASAPASSALLAGAVDGGLEVHRAAVVRSSRISDNSVTATSAGGTANAAGAGIGNLSGRLTVERTIVTGNGGSANGRSGLALGGGILNIAYAGGPPELALTESAVTANELTATPGITPLGGGVFSRDPFDPTILFPVALTRTVIEGNKPDQCLGC